MISDDQSDWDESSESETEAASTTVKPKVQVQPPKTEEPKPEAQLSASEEVEPELLEALFAQPDVQLSKIVRSQGPCLFVEDRRPQIFLRQVFIDGPSVAHGYNSKYSLKNVTFHGFSTVGEGVAPFPVKAVLKSLFQFLSRGNKVTVFLPQFYRDGRPTLHRDISLFVDDYKKLQQLEELQLIEFAPSGVDFAKYIRTEAMNRKAAILTNNVFGLGEEDEDPLGAIFHECRAHRLPLQGEGPNMAACTCPKANVNVDLLPIITPIFYGMERSLAIPLDTPTMGANGPSGEEMLTFDGAYLEIGEEIRDEQLTLADQLRLLYEVDQMLENDYPRGAKDSRVLSLLAEAARKVGVDLKVEIW